MEFLCDCGAVYWTIKDRLWIASRHARLASMHMHAFCVLSKYVWHEQCNTHLLNNTHKLQLVWNADSLIAFSFVHQCLCISLAANDQWLHLGMQWGNERKRWHSIIRKQDSDEMYGNYSLSICAHTCARLEIYSFCYTHWPYLLSLQVSAGLELAYLADIQPSLMSATERHNTLIIFANIDTKVLWKLPEWIKLGYVSQISPTPRPARYLYITSIVNAYSKNCIFPALHTVAQILQAILVGPKAVYKLEILNYRLCCVISSSHFLTASLSAATDHWLLNWYTNIDVQNWMQSSYQHFTQVVIYECYSTSVCCIVHVIHTWTIHKRHAYAC